MSDNKENTKIIMYLVAMTLIVAIGLGSLFSGMKPGIDANVELDKMTSILGAVTDVTADGFDPRDFYSSKIKEVLVDANGKVAEGVAFDIDVKKEERKAVDDRRYLMWQYDSPDGKKFIVPVYGKGLWDDIWGYIALNDDLTSIYGTSFDHKGETPGLGAEISKSWFEDQFKNKTLFNDKGEFVLNLKKGQGHDLDNPYDLDGVSGATITINGTRDMLQSDLSEYLPILKLVNKIKS